MPKKLLIKTLSNSGELLNVINCPAGRVSVFRGSAPADLRPYQRALIGTHGKEKMIVQVDDTAYDPELHNVIGLGEAPPHAGMTVRAFLAKAGIEDDSLPGLLSSFGLEDTADLKCSALSPDQERRIRILSATSQPDRALIANEPFEHITSQWRERFAELLADFAQIRNGLVVISGLSYRPECWIDNSLILRVEVGQSIQRTIGFGQAGSEANQLVEDLRKKLQEERAQGDARRATAAASASAATAGYIPAGRDTGAAPSDLSLIRSWLLSGESLGLKVASTVLAAAVGIGSAILVMRGAGSPTDLAEKTETVALSKPTEQPAENPQGSQSNTLDRAIADAKNEAQRSAGQVQDGGASSVARVRYILDEYPEVIRASIIETTRGQIGEAAPPEGPATGQPPAAPAKSGNLYSLLERASSNEPAAPGGYAPQPPAAVYEEEPYYPAEQEESPSGSAQTEEDQKREAIRAKFLEAIRSAAERRETSLEEE